MSLRVFTSGTSERKAGQNRRMLAPPRCPSYITSATPAWRPFSRISRVRSSTVPERVFQQQQSLSGVDGASMGLLAPPTLVTNDPEGSRHFYEQWNGEVIYKSLSGIRSIVPRLQAEQFARLSLLRNGPAQFQAFIPGENVRVHTVGDHVFATRVYWRRLTTAMRPAMDTRSGWSPFNCRLR